MANRNILTVRQFADANPAFTVASLRWSIFNEKINGLAESGAILRQGRKVLIDADRWFQWLDQANGVKVAA